MPAEEVFGLLELDNLEEEPSPPGWADAEADADVRVCVLETQTETETERQRDRERVGLGGYRGECTSSAIG